MAKNALCAPRRRNRDLDGAESSTDTIESISRDLEPVRTAETPNEGQVWRRNVVPETPAPRTGTSKGFRRNLNLPLAAGPRVRHIRADGAVAEWLKAAVC